MIYLYPPTDSYQYQLQSMWQKCWNTQTLVHNLRFRERGPLKSWRPETMAEAIFSVLKEGLSLSQAARKYDIPYPTFVLYANRVHNMLGPSADGGAGMFTSLILQSWSYWRKPLEVYIFQYRYLFNVYLSRHCYEYSYIRTTSRVRQSAPAL